MSIIVVTGIPRSGTSMMMRMLEAGGVPCIYEQVADKFNPFGYYEHPGPMAGDFSQVPDGHAAKCVYMLREISPELDTRVIVMRREFAVLVASESRRAIALGGRAHGDNAAEFLQGQLDANRLWVASKPNLEVWYEDVLRNPANENLRVARFLDRVPGYSDQPLDLAAMALIPDGRLCHA